MRRIIFHIPVKIDKNNASGSQIRPQLLLKAFKDEGFIVDTVVGYGKQRKHQIHNIKKSIKSGVKYDFLYSESSTMPTALTEPNHIPKYLNLDFNFFKFCKTHQIPIGLFYRDIYWKFPEYQPNSLLKRIILKFFYNYDIYNYKKNINYLYLPSMKMLEYIPNIEIDSFNIRALPPGVMTEFVPIYGDSINKELSIFYVGGIGKVYQFRILLKVISEMKNINLTVCLREQEWINEKDDYKIYINQNINIIHKSGKDLLPYFSNADILSLFLEPNEYRKFAMPLKLFEYIEKGKPIIATSNTAVGEFVKENDIGWVIDYNYNELKNLLEYINNNKHEINIKKQNIKKCAHLNSWKNRVKQISKDLSI
jgi:glycosyltransferase involved in cell wall biosynthesis